MGAVVVGMDFSFAFPALMRACLHLEDPDCLFLATEPDQQIILEGRTFPGEICRRCFPDTDVLPGNTHNVMLHQTEKLQIAND